MFCVPDGCVRNTIMFSPFPKFLNLRKLRLGCMFNIPDVRANVKQSGAVAEQSNMERFL